MKKSLFILLATCSLLISCNQQTKNISVEKPKYLWIDAEANFRRFETQDSVQFYLDKAKATGFNTIVIDARPISGQVFYKKTEMMQEAKTVKGYTIERDWDYLEYFIQELHKRGMKAVVSMTVFPVGHPNWQKGYIYDFPEVWKGKTAIQYKPEGFVDIRDERQKVAAFLSPHYPEVQDYALSFISEVVKNYDLDGIALDYCRFSDMQTDFSPYAREQFEKYLGKKVENWPEDILSYNEKEEPVYGPLTGDWYDFRALTIHDFIVKARQTIKALKPEVELNQWAASWYKALAPSGINWASQEYDPEGSVYGAGPNYQKAGIAELLDNFILGAYLEKVFGAEDQESMEHAILNAKKVTMGKCKIYGSMYATLDKSKVADAAYLLLKETDGLAVFDMVQLVKYNSWDEYKKGIDRAEEEMRKEALSVNLPTQ